MTVTRVVAALAGCWLAAPVLSHPLAPALLELRETQAQQYDVLWRTSMQRVQVQDLAPQLPPACVAEGVEPAVAAEGQALSLRWSVRCEGGLEGQTLRFGGLERSQVNVIVRIEPLHGAPIETLLDARQAEYTVPDPATAPPVFGRYFELGVGHLLGGFDHLLFLAGLVLLISGWRRLLLTVTAFTLGHSLTLALATLGYVRVSPPLIEFGIALSILVLAVQLTRSRDAHLSAEGGESSVRPYFSWSVAAGFGLLHGLGFAGALAQAGLPADAIVPALLGFNLGIEAAQLGVIALLAGGGWMVRRLPDAPVLAARAVPVYLIGTLAAYWCFERASVALG